VNIPSIWSKQSGKFFCISTRSPEGSWEDEFFTKEEFHEIRGFVKDHMGSDVYFCPHGFNRRRRRKDFAVLPRLCYADLDEVDPRNLKIKPTIVLETSPGRYAGFWLTDLPITESLNRRLTYAIGADKGGWDLSQVLRFPNTFNHKYKAKPRVTTLWDDGPTYTIKRLEKLLPPEEVVEDSGLEAGVVYRKYEEEFPHWLRRGLISDKPEPGKRSETIWKISNTLLELGLTQEEAFVLIKASPWNKFAGRNQEDDQLRRELDKSLDKHLNGHSHPKHKEANGHNIDLKFLTTNMAEVEEEELDWLWYPYLAKNELTILEGDPGLGKSYLAQMIGGAIVDGKSLPSVKPQGKKPVKGRVVYFDIENSAGTVSKRRLVDNNVQNLKDYIQEENIFSIDNTEVVDQIYEALEEVNPILVVFDTLNTYIGKADTHKSSETQQAFGTFRQIAKDFDCAVLVLRHLTKSKGGEKAIYRGQGSIAFSGLARVVMTVGQLPDDPDIKVLAVTKINVTKAPRALTFSIDELPKDHSRFSWGEFVDISSEDIIAYNPKKPGGSNTVLEETKQFLKDTLSEGPLDHLKIKRMAEKRSISAKSLQRAGDALGIEKLRSKEGLRWALP
jgi:AAA domain-containing protein